MENLKLNKSNSPLFVSILLFILFASLFGIFYSTTTGTIKEKSIDVFNGEVLRTEQGLSNYAIFYENILGSLKGFFQGSQEVESDEFQNFIKDISISTDYKPISSFSYIQKVNRGEVDNFYKDIKSQLGPSEIFDPTDLIKSLNPDSEEYFLIKYSEPGGVANERLLGLDFAEVHPTAFDLAVKTGRTVTTRVFVNPYSNKNEITVFSPVYRLEGSGLGKEVDDGIMGLVAINFKTKDLLESALLPGSPDRLISVDVYEGAEVNPKNLVYSNASYSTDYSQEHAIIKTMEVGGRPWTLRFSTTPRFNETVAQKNTPEYIILAGFLISLGMSLLSYFILSSRNRAIKLAEGMTFDLEKSESNLRRSNRSLRIISEANQLIVKSKEEEKLLHAVCNTLIKNAGYLLVWIGYVENDEAKTVRVVAWAGRSEGYIENLDVSWSEENPRGLGPTGRAIRENKIVVVPDFSKDKNFAPWIENAKKRGYVGSAAIPLVIESRVMGVLNIYSSELETFGTDEINMLHELGDDLAYSISNIRTSIQKEEAERSLRENEKILSVYMRNSPIFTFIKERTPDGKMKVLRASDNYHEMIGSAGMNMEGKTMEELFPKDFAEKITKDDISVIESGNVLKINEDLNGRNYSTIKFPIVLDGRKLLAGYTIDITDAKNAEKILRQSEEKFSKAFKGFPYASALTTHDSGEIIDINDSFTGIFGYSKDEAIGKTTTGLGIWASATDREVMLNEMAKQGVVKNLKVNLRKKSGEDMIALLSVQLINIGENRYIYSIINDITEQEKIRARLASKMEELQQFRSAVDSASDHIIITDPNAKIVYANIGAERTTGYSASELIGKTPSLWGGQMPEEFYENMWHTIKIDKQPFVGELRNKRKNGQIYDAQFSISPILNDQGEIIYFVGVERDITKAKAIERSKNEFVSLASHQLRTPLTAINWYAEMLLGGDAGKINEKQKDYLNELHGSSKRMTDLVSALLNVSRIDLGTFTINPKPTDVIKITKGVLKDLFMKIEKKKLKVLENYVELPQINVDPNLLTIILQNLISNAVKYTRDGGEIRIIINKDQKNICITVADNGYGIPAGQQDRIFEKFFRADNIIPVETDGNGLGLYMVKQILDSAGGTISFVSKEDEGATFIVKIPASGMKEREGTKILEQKGFGI